MVNMDTIQKYHPFTINFKKDYLDLVRKHTETLKAYKNELDSFYNHHSNVQRANLTIADWEKLQALEKRLADFETMALQKLEAYAREQTHAFLVLFKNQLRDFIAYKKLAFILDKSLVLFCQPCNDYSKEVLSWIERGNKP